MHHLLVVAIIFVVIMAGADLLVLHIGEEWGVFMERQIAANLRGLCCYLIPVSFFVRRGPFLCTSNSNIRLE